MKDELAERRQRNSLTERLLASLEVCRLCGAVRGVHPRDGWDVCKSILNELTTKEPA